MTPRTSRALATACWVGVALTACGRADPSSTASLTSASQQAPDDGGTVSCRGAQESAFPTPAYQLTPGGGCGLLSCSTAPNAPRFTGVTFRFPCDCDTDPTSNPVLDVAFEVADTDTPTASLQLVASIMGCEHPGYVVTGTAFSSKCKVTGIPSATFASPWNVAVTDPEGHTVTAYLIGPSVCGSEHRVCVPSSSPSFSFNCGG
jgi:hypothetical protein